MRILVLIAAALPLLAPALPAAGQQRTPNALADSVARIPTESLRTLVQATPPSSSGALDHLYHGLVAKRLYETEPSERLRETAERSFDRAKDRDPSLAWAHYGYGWSLAEAGEVRIPIPGLRRIVTFGSIAELVGLDATSRAQRAIREALTRDPALAPAAIDLGRIALATRSASDAEEAVGALTKVLQGGDGSVDAYLVLAELELARRNNAAAAEAARAAAVLSSEPATLRVLAITLLSNPLEREAGAEQYMRAFEAAAADTGMIAAYETDITPIAAEGEIERWQRMPAADRAAWLREFWQRRADDAVLSVGERLHEHFERLRVADAQYRRLGDYGSRAGDATLYRPPYDLPYDDRGLVYLRYGRPDSIVSTPPAADDMPPPNETWAYFRAGDRPLAFNFFKLEGTPDWVIAEAPRCYAFHFAMGTPNRDVGEPLTLMNKRYRVEDFARYYTDRAFIDPLNMQTANNCLFLVEDVLRAQRAQGSNSWAEVQERAGDFTRRHLEVMTRQRNMVADAMKAEDARPSYDRPLPLLTTIYAFRGERSTDVTAAVLIPSEDFTASTVPGGTVYPLRMSFVLHDSASGASRSTHELQRFGSPETLPAGRYFRVMLHTTAQPYARGDYRLRVENEGTGEEGQVQVGASAIPDFTGSALQLSDLVVAEAEGGRWRRGATAVSPIPTHQVETGRTFRLFYEVYNLAENTPYRTTLQIRPAEAQGVFDRIRSLFGRGRTIELTFDDAAGASDGRFGIQEVRSIGAELSPGRYTMTVIVTDLSGNRTAQRSAPLNVIEVQPGS
jgi:GWxTD domain-containing protein